MKKLTAILTLLAASPAFCDNNFSIGLGQHFGGFIGAAYTHNTKNADIFVGLGLLSMVNSEYNLGWQIGFDIPIDSKNELGLSYGTAFTESFNGFTVAYKGPSLNYTHYFSGREQSSWILGASYTASKPDEDTFFTKDNRNSISLILGYQF